MMIRKIRQNISKGILLFLLVWAGNAIGFGSEPLYTDPMAVNAAAYSSMGAYSGQIDRLPWEELQREGFRLEDKVIDGNRVLLAQREIGSGKQYIIAIAGTESKAGWRRDFDWSLVPFNGSSELQVHKGFYDLAKAILKDSEVTDVLSQGLYKEGNEVILTGHSLGGATALLLGADVLDTWQHGTGNLAVIAFGAPMPGNDAFVKKLDNLPGRAYEMKGDVIPRILQAVSSDYKGSLPIRVKWESKNPYEMLYHSMARYLDEAQRQAGLVYNDTAEPAVKNYYIALPEIRNKADMPESVTVALQKSAAHAFYRTYENEAIVDEQPMLWSETMVKARKLGYGKAVRIELTPDIEKTSKTQSYNIKVTLTVYNTKTGNVMDYQTLMMNRGSYTILPKTVAAISNMAGK